MPHSNTFSVPPIGDFVKRYLEQSKVSIDPFARDCTWATHTNDLNPATAAQHHLQAEEFCRLLGKQDIGPDLVLLDPPYSPRQISECYKEIGRPVTMADTQSAILYRKIRNAVDSLLNPGAIVLSFGWNSVGMGLKRGYDLIELMLCCHGGAHNDTICIAERKLARMQQDTLSLQPTTNQNQLNAK